MKISDEQRSKLLAYFDKYWKEKKCDVCKSSNWAAQDVIFQQTEYTPGGFTMGGTVVPVVAFGCEVCGNTYFLNAIVIGLIDPEKKGGAND